LKKMNKTGKQIIVAGCMASVQSEKIKSIVPDAQLLPPQYSHHIVDLLNQKTPVFMEKNKTLFSKHYDNITAPIAIAEGCLFSCSYCITSLARGKLKSFPIYEIAEDICFAIKQGCKEIQLTAQDTSSYGLDKDSNLGELLRNVSIIDGEYRIRVGMMNPYTSLKNLDSILGGFNSKNIYKFLHMPVQSGDNEILTKMDRKYSVEDFLRIIKKFRERYSDISLSTDVIVGFPSETNEQFQHTIDLLKTVKPDITNITRFSARPFTKAKIMKGRIKTEIVKQRSKILTEICSKISKDNNLQHIGKNYNVLVTERGKDGTWVGRAENYKPVVIRTEASSTYLVGSII
jgi:MiaB-like tRNA modifying enzyme